MNAQQYFRIDSKNTACSQMEYDQLGEKLQFPIHTLTKRQIQVFSIDGSISLCVLYFCMNILQAS